MRRFLGAVVVLMWAGCGEPTPVTGRFGEVTSAVVVVNPVINQGSTTSVTPGPARSGVLFWSADLEPVVTDPTGIAMV